MKKHRITAIIVVVVALAAAIVGSQSRAATKAHASRATTKVHLTLDWTPNPDHVALYYALNKAFFTKAGLNVSMQAPSDPSVPLKLVGVNKTDLAISYEPELFYGAQKNLPAKAVAAVVPVPLNSLIALKSSRINKLSDLKGKSVGTTGIPSDEAIFATMLHTAGLKSGEVKNVHVGYNLVSSLLSHKVDAIIGGYRNVEAIQVGQKVHQKPTVFPANQLGVPNYNELVLVANSKRLKSDSAYAAMVRKFIGAMVAAATAARANPTAATAIMGKATQYDSTFLKSSVPLTLSLLKPSSAKIGCMSAAQWQSFGRWMLNKKLIKKPVKASTVMTTAYLGGC
jgi:putative hydroxymethylpyrimidine transport system substrate-binding protein